jgi:hypothetical protein
MLLDSIVALLILAVSASASGQSKPQPKAQPSPRSAAKAATKPVVLKPNYLAVPLDLSQTNLGHDFVGHDIAAVVEAIKNSAALKEKSEFESTTEFENRRAAFIGQPLYASVAPNSYLAFVVDEDPILHPMFKYDADSQILMVELAGRAQTFFMDKERSTLDGVLIRRSLLDRDSYVGSNAFGAKVEVERAYFEEYGVVFSPGSWMFQASEGFDREFEYLLPMGPDEARALKADAKIVVVCRLAPPWYHEGAHGHDPTISDPYESKVGDNYLQVVPEQIWIFNHGSGEVIRKISESSLASERDGQFRLRLRQTPVLLEISSETISLGQVAVDDGPATIEDFSNSTKKFGAKRKIVLTLETPQSLSDVILKVNGKPFAPDWKKDSTSIGNQEFIHSATVVITAP